MTMGLPELFQRFDRELEREAVITLFTEAWEQHPAQVLATDWGWFLGPTQTEYVKPVKRPGHHRAWPTARSLTKCA